MNKIIIFGTAALTLLITVLILTTCSNPFTAGLGEKVDLEAPQLEITSHHNGDAVGSVFDLLGTVIDDGQIESVIISLNTESNVIGSAIITDSSWSFNYDSTALADGDYEFLVVATDNTDKSVSRKVMLTVDNNPPTVLVTVPANYGIGEEFNKKIAIKGEASDTTRVKEVFISLYNTNGTLADTSDDTVVFYDVSAIGTSSWYYIFDSAILDAGSPLIGDYYFFVRAEDFSGNSNSYFYHFADIFDLAVDKANLPNIEEINNADFGGVPITAGILSANPDTIRHTANLPDQMAITINPDSDSPEFLLISPSSSANPADNVFASPQRFSGFVIDDDPGGIDPATLKITIWKIDDLAGEVYSTTSITDEPIVDLTSTQWSFSTNLADGEYYLSLYAEDYDVAVSLPMGNPTDAQPATFRVSSFAPIVTVTAPTQGSYAGSGSTTTVTVSVTGMGTGTVELDPNGDDNYADSIAMVDQGSDIYSVDITDGVNGFTVLDGNQLIKIRAGTSGNYGTASLQLVGDTTGPTITVTYPADGATVNGTFNITGSASDDNQISQVYVWISEEAVPATLPPADIATWNTPDGSNVYNWISNTDTTILNTGAHTMHFITVDAAGNFSNGGTPQTLAFTVDQSSDIPVISFLNITDGGPASVNGLGQDASIIGQVTDDDLVDVATLEIRIDIGNDGFPDLHTNANFPVLDGIPDGIPDGKDLNLDGDLLDDNEGEVWTTVSDKPASNSPIISWSHSLLNLPQGEHSLQVRVNDSNGIYDESLVTPFIIDYGPPDVVITGPATGITQTGAFTINGTSTDPNGVLDVEISITGGIFDGSFNSVLTSPSGTSPVNWEYTDFILDAGGTPDGEYAYQIRSTDSSGGKTTIDRQIVVDTTSPTIVIETPSAAASVNGTAVTVRGTADDNRNVSAVYVDINPQATSPEGDHLLWDFSGIGTYNWSTTFNSITLLGTDTPANYVISVKAVDGAGNISTEYTRTISIDQPSDRPVITFNDIDKDETVAANNVLVGATTLTGIIEDDDLIDPALFSGNSIEIWIDSGPWVPVSIPPAASGKFVVWRHDISSLSEGPHLVKVRTRDNQSDGNRGSASTDALYTSNFNWNIEDSSDQNGVPFILNLGPPSITIDTPANYSFHNTDVVISGTSVDANGVDTVKISFDNGNTWSADIFTADPNWTYTLPITDGDGTKTYIIQATDMPGSTGIENGQFTIDATIPTSTINLPADGATVNGQLTISGIAGDNINLSKVYYHIDLAANPAPTYPDDYTLFGGFYSWNDTIDTTSMADNTYSLRVRSEDAAGNLGNISSVNFDVDQTSDQPVISFNSITEAGTFVDNLLPSSRQIAGNITDDDSVDVSTIEYQLYAEDGTTLLINWTPISGAPGSDTTLATWTHVIPDTFVDTEDSDVDLDVVEVLPISDGRYQIKLRAADTYDAGAFTGGGFGWDTSALIKFAVDTANPETTISPTNGGYTNQDFTVSGTATDDGGIKRVEIQFNAEPVIELYVDADLLAPFNTSQGWSTSYTIDTAGHGDDGVLNFVITVTDAYNKIKTYDRYVNVDTQFPVINSPTLVNNDAGTPAIINGSILIQGAPIDYQTLVNAVYITTTDDLGYGQPSDPGIQPLDNWVLQASTANIYHRFDSTALTNATAYTTYIVVEDLAGNRTAVTDYSFSFTTNESGNDPVITINTPDSSLLNTGDNISGSITDDDGVDVSTIGISIDGAAFIPVTSTSASNSTNVVFSHSLGSLSEQIASYSIQIRTFDIGEDFVNNTQDIAPVLSTSAAINIFVDDSDPTAGITLIDNGNTTAPTLQGLYINDQFTITGTSADGVQIADVRAKLDIAGDLFTTVPVTDTGTNFDTWSWTRSGLPVFGADSVIMNLEVEDIHGKVTPYSYTLLVDETVPNISITTAAVNPSTVSGAYNGTQIFRGTSSDNVQISTIYYIFDSASNPATTDPVTDSWNIAAGTYSWNFSLDTVNDATFGNNTAVDSTVYLGVVSVDSAGNVSAVNNISFTINQGSDQPVLTVTQPADGGLIESNKKVIGSLSDDDGLTSLQIRIDRNNDGDFNDTDEGYVNVSQPATVSGVNINFEHDLSALADGGYKIQLQAVDNVNASTFDTTTSSVISFDIDTLAPALTLNQITVQNRYGGADVDITNSFNGSYVNNDSILYFSASDSSGISDVEISTNGGTDWVSASEDLIVGSGIDVDGNGDYSVLLTIPAGDLLDGTRNISYRATDARGKTTTSILTVIIDSIEPVIDFSNPLGVTTALADDAPNVNGDVAIRGSVSDSSSISSVSLLGGKVTDVILTNTGNTISWITQLAGSGTYAGISYAYNTGDTGASPWDDVNDGDETWTNIWRFPVEVTAQDLAGNITTTTGFIDIDPDSDNPIVSIVSPANDTSVSGTFLVNGTIIDDDGTDYVTLEFDFDDDGAFDDVGDTLPGTELSISNDLNGNSLADDTIDESTSVQLTAPNGSWSIALNASDFTIAKLNTAGYVSANGFLRLRLIPYDTNGLAGASQTVRIYLDTTSPVIAGLDVDGSTRIAEPTPATGTIQKGTLTLRVQFEDDKELLTSSMLISYDGGATFDQISNQPGALISYVGGTTDPYEYRIEIPVDTSTAIAGGNGVLQIQLSVTDQTNKQQSKSIKYNVDNNLPTIYWNEDGVGTLLDLPFIGTPPNEVYNFKGNESTGAGDDAYKVLGAAIDSGSISGISKVNVYFVKGGSFWSPTDGASTAVANSDIADDTGTPVSIPFTENSSYVITIDNRIEQGLFDQTGGIGDFDGFQESLKAKAGYDEWYSFFDTTQLPDGPLEIYGIAYDEAGNMSYTVTDAQIANNPPAIPTVVVGSTTIDDTTYRTKNAGTVDFTINMADAEGIDVSTIQLYITDRYTIVSGLPDTVDGTYTPPAALTSVDFDSITPGTDSTAEVAVESVDTTAFTSGYYYRYVAEANDTDGNIVQRIFYVWVNNSDSSAPTVTIDDFSQTSVSGGNGHVEEEINSLNDAADPDTLVDADLSGTVTVSGTAYDDSSVSTLTVEFSLDAGSTWADAGTASVVTVGGDVISGFDYTWTYDWDTSTITGIAEEDVLIRAYGTDGTNTTATGNRPEKIVDVVPYITDISGTGFDSGLLAYVKRSATGRYPVTVGSTLTIDGYNLPGTAADAFSIGGTTLTAGSATGSTQMTIPLLTTNTSGGIFVITNSVSSLNNTNDNTLPQNEEDNAYNANLSDNREAVFWDVTALSGTTTVTDPSMQPNAAGNDFDWMYVKSGKDLYFLPGGSTEKQLSGGTGLQGGTFTYNSNGTLMFLFNHNAQFSFTDNSYRYTGSVQWGAIPNYSAYTFTADRDEAYNWNQNQGIPRLGLGNISFNDAGGTLPNTVGIGDMSYGYTNLDLNRYKNIKLRTVGGDTTTRNYTAYFDSGASESRSIVFYAFKTGTTQVDVQGGVDLYYSSETAANKLDPWVPLASTDNGATNTAEWYANIDKHYDDAEDDHVTLTGLQANNSNGIATPRGRQEVTTANAGNDSEQFDLEIYEVDGTTHYGFIAYFDEAAQSLKITANESLYNADPTGTLGTWTPAFTVDTNAGADVAIAVDPNGGIHLAYQDVSTGYLKYAYLTFNDGATSGTFEGDESFTTVKQVYVDALFGAGANNSIAIRDFGVSDYRPVIVTFSSAYTGTKAPLRLSYPLYNPTDGSFGAGADSSTSAFLGNWETIALPAGSNPENVENFLFIDSSNNAHLGYEGSGLEESTFMGF